MFTPKPYNVYQSVISKDDCHKIIKVGEQQNLINAKIQEGNQNNRKSSVSWIKDKSIENILSSTIKTCNKIWNYNLKEFEPFQYTVYKESDFYDWHVDVHNKLYSNGLIRKLSFTLLLNDEYEGGEFEICIPNPKQKQNKYIKLNNNQIGTMIIFPSFVWHKVNPIIRGIRKSLVGWIVGKPFS
jgi:PKHD-type hydroxylase